MADFTVRSDHIDVEQIMRQIRARVRDKRGADYTEAEIRELANVKLDKFLDPKAVRSDLLLHYRQQRRPANEAPMPLYAFDPNIVYDSDRGTPGRILTFIRKLLNPILKLFFNPSPLLHVVHLQTQINERMNKALVTREEFDALNFEMFNNLVVELTRVGIEVRNLRMQVESFGTRLDFDERRARALEGAVQYKPGAPVARPPQPQPPSPAAASQVPASQSTTTGDEGGAGGDEEEGTDGETGRARRRRRRRGRRRGQGGADTPGAEGAESDGPSASAESAAPRAEDHRRVRETPPAPYGAGREPQPAPASQDIIGTSAYDAPHEEPAAQPIVPEESAWQTPSPVEPVSAEPVSSAAYEPAAYEPPAVHEPIAQEPVAHEPAVHESAAYEPAAYEPAHEPAAAEPVAEPEPPAREWRRVTSDPVSAAGDVAGAPSPWPLADPEPAATPASEHWPEAEPPVEPASHAHHVHHDALTPPATATDESPAPDSIVPRAGEPDEPSRS